MLVVNPLVWYSAVIYFLQTFLVGNPDAVLIWGVHFLGIICSALGGTLLQKRIGTDRFLSAWMVLGAISPLSVFIISFSSLAIVCSIVLILGVSLGIGMPACMGYYTNSVPVEVRGRTSGFVLFFTAACILGITVFASAYTIFLGIVLAVWRLVGFLVFQFLKSQNAVGTSPGVSSYRQVLSQQSFILYLVPWVMFSLVNYLAGTVQLSILQRAGQAAIVGPVLSAIQNVMMGIFALIGGFLLDFVGRKRIAICGFVMLGIDAAALGLFSDQLWANYLTATVDGVAWGFLWVIFIVTIWGDLANHVNSSKYYAIGVLPFFASKFVSLTYGNSLSSVLAGFAQVNGLFSFLAFFLFLAVLPLVYAPETLPDKVMKDRDLKSYVEKAKKKMQTEAEKEQKSTPLQAEESKGDFVELEVKPEEGQAEYEEAEKLAEKYY